MITVIVPKRKRVPKLKKQAGVWEVLYSPALYEFHDEYRVNTMLLQGWAEKLNRRERALRNIMRNMPLKQHSQNIEDSI